VYYVKIVTLLLTPKKVFDEVKSERNLNRSEIDRGKWLIYDGHERYESDTRHVTTLSSVS